MALPVVAAKRITTATASNHARLLKIPRRISEGRLAKPQGSVNDESRTTDPDDALHPFVSTAKIPISSVLCQGSDHIFAVKFVKYTEIIMGFRRIGLQGDGLFMLFLRVVQTIQVGIDHAQIQMGFGIFRAIPDDFQELAFGLDQQSLAPKDKAQVVMSIDEVRLDCNGLLKA